MMEENKPYEKDLKMATNIQRNTTGWKIVTLEKITNKIGVRRTKKYQLQLLIMD